MNQLISTTQKDGIQLVDARLLHQKLQSKTQFKDWFPRRIKEYNFDEGKDYFTDNQVLLKNELNLGGRPRIEYFLTIDMAKEIAMVERTSVGKQVRNYFIEVEKHAQQLILKIPKPIMVEGTHECLQYDFWLIQNGYSVSSGQFHRRIKKHPRNFYKGGNGKWYISRKYANALLEFKECGKKLTECLALPTWEQISLFN